MFAKLLEPVLRKAGWKGTVEVHKVHGMKEARILGNLETAIKNHRLVLDTNVVKDDLRLATKSGSRVGKFALLEFSGLYQLTHLANQRGALRKDDRADVLSNMVAYFNELMALDSEKAVQDEKRKQSHEFAKLLMATQVGGQNTTLTSPQVPSQVRGAGRAVGRGRRPSPRALQRASIKRGSMTWRRR
jgi:hypothetical protein